MTCIVTINGEKRPLTEEEKKLISDRLAAALGYEPVER